MHEGKTANAVRAFSARGGVWRTGKTCCMRAKRAATLPAPVSALRAANIFPWFSTHCSRSIGVARGHLAGDLRALFQIAADDHVGRRRALAIALLIAAIAAIEAGDHAGAPVAARGLGVDDGLHLVAPFEALVGAAEIAQIVQRAEDLGEALEAAVERGGGDLGARGRRRRGERGGKRSRDEKPSQHGRYRAAIVAAQPDGKKASPGQPHPASFGRWNAAATISARPGVVGRPASSPGSSQRASLSSSLSTGSPARQRDAKHRMMKCRSTRLAASRAMASRKPASATGSIARPVSSRTSRATASVSVSPISTTPPGRVNRPLAGGRARRTTRILPSRTIAALTATKGRSG